MARSATPDARRATLLGGATLLALAALCGDSGAAEAQRAKERALLRHYETVNTAEAISRTPCEAVPGRVFVLHPLGSECIAYYVVEGTARPRHTILFLDGDVPPKDAHARGQLDGYLTKVRRFLKERAQVHGVRFVYVARPGLFGSSGNHGGMKSRTEVGTINAAVDAIKERLGVADVSLAGQSGGAMLAAGLLTLGRRDVSCAVLASGGFDLADIVGRGMAKAGVPADIERARSITRGMFYDVMDATGTIPRVQDRRLFVVGDPRDQRTPFDQQVRFADAVRKAGHHAVVLKASARDSEHHGLAQYAIELAARCAKGESEGAMRKVLAPN